MDPLHTEDKLFFITRVEIRNLPAIYLQRLIYIEIRGPGTTQKLILCEKGPLNRHCYGYYFLKNLSEEDLTFLKLSGVHIENPKKPSTIRILKSEPEIEVEFR